MTLNELHDLYMQIHGPLSEGGGHKGGCGRIDLMRTLHTQEPDVLEDKEYVDEYFVLRMCTYCIGTMPRWWTSEVHHTEAEAIAEAYSVLSEQQKAFDEKAKITFVHDWWPNDTEEDHPLNGDPTK